MIETLVSNLSPKRSAKSFNPGAFRGASFLTADPAGPPTAPIETLASRIVAEGLSVRATEEIVSIGAVGGPAGSAVRKLAPLKAPGLKDLADRLGDKLDTRVSITMGKAKGKVVIEFSTLEDLRRIVDEIEKN